MPITGSWKALNCEKTNALGPGTAQGCQKTIDDYEDDDEDEKDRVSMGGSWKGIFRRSKCITILKRRHEVRSAATKTDRIMARQNHAEDSSRVGFYEFAPNDCALMILSTFRVGVIQVLWPASRLDYSNTEREAETENVHLTSTATSFHHSAPHPSPSACPPLGI
jgi:hypothetical protein